VDIEHPDPEPRGFYTSFCDRVWNVMEFEIKKDTVVRRDFADEFWPDGCEELKSDLKCGGIAPQLRDDVPSVVSSFDVECDYHALFGFRC
jgi:hypothetical protein